MNKGFKLAEGGILAWLNSDDIYLPGALQTAVTFFRDNPEKTFLYGDAHYCDPDGNIIGRYPTEEFDIEKLAYFNFICQPSTFFRKSAFDTLGGLDETLNFTMDYDFFVRIAKRFPTSYLPQFFSKYRLHETSKTMNSADLNAYHEEILSLTLKYFDWAPLNQVYGACYYNCLARLPIFMKKFRFLLVGAAASCTLLRSFRLNRGIRRADFKLLRLDNFQKMFKERMEILRGNS